MAGISVGRIVTKTMGRETGRKAVVTRLIDRNFAEISGPFELTGVKRRRVNLSHIEPSQFEISISKDDNEDKKIVKLIEADSDLKKFMTSKV